CALSHCPLPPCATEAESRVPSLLHSFPHFFRIPPLPQTLSLLQLVPHCVNPATSIRITNKLFLTIIYYCTTLSFERRAPTRPSRTHAPRAIPTPSPLRFFPSLCPQVL